MKLTGLITKETIDTLISGVEYVQYIDKDTKHIDEPFYTERLVGLFRVFIGNKNVSKYLLVAGKYRRSISNDGKVIHEFIGDNKKHYQEIINDKSLFQSITDFEKDFKRSGDIQENALSNAMGRAIASKHLLGKDDPTNLILSFLSDAAAQTNYPTGKDEYNPITKKEQDAENRSKWEKKWPKTLIRSNSLENNNNIVKHKPKHSSSLSNIHRDEDEYIEEEEEKENDDIISHKTHNKTHKNTSLLNRVRSIFWNWKNSKSRVHVEKGGKRKTRNNKKTKKSRKTKCRR
jgi:hypothetical protein